MASITSRDSGLTLDDLDNIRKNLGQGQPNANAEKPEITLPDTTASGTISAAEYRAARLLPRYENGESVGAWSIKDGMPRAFAQTLGTIFGEGVEFTGRLTSNDALRRYGGDIIETFREVYGYEYNPNATWENAKSSAAKGNPFPVLHYMWEHTPQSIAYLPYVATGAGSVFAVGSETNRIAKDRARNDGRTEADLEVSDFVYAFPAAVVNIVGERIAGIKPLQRAFRTGGAGVVKTAKRTAAEIVGKEMGTEFIQGGTEEAMSTIDTQTGLNLARVLDQGAAEAVAAGGHGAFTAAGVTVLNRHQRKRMRREQLKALMDEGGSTVDPETLNSDLRTATENAEDSLGNALNETLKAYELEVGKLDPRTDPTTIVEGSRDLPGYDTYQFSIHNILRRAFGGETVDLYVAVDTDQLEALEAGAEFDRAFVGSVVSHGVSLARGQSAVQITVPIDNVIMRGDAGRQQFAFTPAGMALTVPETGEAVVPPVTRETRPVLPVAEGLRRDIEIEQEEDVLAQEFEVARAEGLAERSKEKSAEKATNLARRLASKILNRLPDRSELVPDSKDVSAAQVAQIIRKRKLPAGAGARGVPAGDKNSKIEVVRTYRNALERPNQIGAINAALKNMGYRLVRRGKNKALHFEPIAYGAETLVNSGVGSTRVQDRLIDDYFELLESKVQETRSAAVRQRTRAKKATEAERRAEKERARVVPENVAASIQELESEFVTREPGKKVSVDWEGLRKRVQSLKDNESWSKKERKAINDYVDSLETETRLGRPSPSKKRTITVGFFPSSSIFGKLRTLTGQAFHRFHADAHRVITSAAGKDMLLGKLAGIYVNQKRGILRVAGVRNPIATLTLSPKADQGKISRLYALASMYIYRTGSVSMSMPDVNLDVEIEQTNVGATIKFKKPLGNRENLFIGELNKAFGDNASFTVTSPTTISVYNTGKSKADFARTIGKLYGRTKAKYGYTAELFTTTTEEVTHNWDADPTGESIRNEFREAGFGDLLTYLDDRREAFDEVAKKYGVTDAEIPTTLESPTLVVSTTDRKGRRIPTKNQLELFDMDEGVNEPYPKTRKEAEEKSKNFLERIVQRLGGSLLANKISSDFRDKGQTTLIGQVAESIEDLAAIAQIYRNPMFETARYFFFDENNKIIAQTGVTSRHPASVKIVPDVPGGGQYATAESLVDMIKNAQSLGAVSMSMLHNHPGGNPRPSEADVQVHDSLARIVKHLGMDYRGSLILDQSRYAFIPGKNPFGSWEYRSAARSFGRNLKKVPEEAKNIIRGDRKLMLKDHPMLGRDILRMGDLALAGIDLTKSAEQFVIVSRDAEGKIAGLMELPIDALVGEFIENSERRKPLTKQQKLRVTATLRAFLRMTGGSYLYGFNYPTFTSAPLRMGGHRKNYIKTHLERGRKLLSDTGLFRLVSDHEGNKLDMRRMPDQGDEFKGVSIGGGIWVRTPTTFADFQSRMQEEYGPQGAPIHKWDDLIGEDESGTVTRKNFTLNQKIEEYKTLQHSDYDKLSPELKTVVDRRIDSQDNPDATRQALRDNAGTDWSRQAIEGAIFRDAMEYLIRGEKPPYLSIWDYNTTRVQNFRKKVEAGGYEAIWAEAERVGLVGHADKPVNSVNSSFLNCEPSKNCAKFCYATKGFYIQTNNILKGELTDWAVQNDPARAAKIIARNYSGMAEFYTGKALRIFDKGDGNNQWAKFVEEINKVSIDGNRIRIHVFSKHPDFLRKVSDFNLRLLSIDQTNLQLAIDNPDLGIAYVYEGTDADVSFLEQQEERFKKHGGVILPVKLGQKLLGEKAVSLLPAWAQKGKARFVCPIDDGIKKVGKANDEWNCTRCDKGGGLGCYHGQVTKTIIDTIEKARSTSYGKQLEQNEDALRRLAIEQFGPVRGPELLTELDTLLGLAQGGIDSATEIEGGVSSEGVLDEIVIPPAKAARLEPYMPAPSGLSSPRVREALVRDFGEENIAHFEQEGILNIVDSVRSLSPELQAKAKEAGAVYGMYVDNKGYLFSDQLNSESARQMFMHEIGVHYGLPKVLGAEAYSDIITDLVNNKNSKQLKPYFDDVRGAYDYADDTVEQVEEVIALLVQTRNSHKFTVVEKIFRALIKFIRENTPLNIKLSQRDVQYLVRGAIDKIAMGDGPIMYGFNGEVKAARSRVKHGFKHRGNFPVDPISEPNTIRRERVHPGADVDQMNSMRDAVKEILIELGAEKLGIRVHYPNTNQDSKSAYVLINNSELGELLIRQSDHPIEADVSTTYIPIVDFSESKVDKAQIRKAIQLLIDKKFDGIDGIEAGNESPKLIHNSTFWFQYRMGDPPRDINRELARKVKTWPEYVAALVKVNKQMASAFFDSEVEAIERGRITDSHSAIGVLTKARYNNATKSWNYEGRVLKEWIKKHNLDPKVFAAALPPKNARDDFKDEDNELLARINKSPEKKSLWSLLGEFRLEAGLKLTQGIIDSYRPIAVKLGNDGMRAWQMMHLSDNAHGIMHAMLHFGKPKEYYRDGEFDWYGLDTSEQEGLIPILQDLNGETNEFFGWIIGNRANKLSKPTKEHPEGREHHFEADEIKRMMHWNQGTMVDGRSRALVYAKAMRKLSEYQESVLDIAANAGILTPELRASLETDFYVPFYRAFEVDNKEVVRGPTMSNDFVNMKDVIQKLHGSELALNDVLHNTLMNWHSLLNGSMKNRAAVAAMEAAEKAGAAVDLYKKFYAEIKAANPKFTDKEISGRARREVAKVAFGKREAKGSKYENYAYVLKDGERVWYEVNDPLVINSLVQLHWGGSDGKAIRTMSKFKRAFTIGVTANPIFKGRNLIRDTVHSVAVSKGDLNIFGNVAKGLKTAKLGDPIYSDMLAGGAAFSFGFLNDDPSAIRRLVALGVKNSDILDTHEKVGAFMKKGWDYWGEVGNRMENANRAALYMKRRGEVGHMQASFEARDLLNFSSHGSWYVTQLLMSALPFTNARLQGLNKLARSVKYKEQRHRFLAVTGTVVLASIGYSLMMQDDEDYQQLPDWVKDTYWPIKVPGTRTFFYLPKPFEIGAIASIGERLTKQFVDGTQDFWGKNNTASRIAQIVMDQLAFDFRPQIIRPVMEVMRNYDSFMDRRIESWSWERLPDYMKYHSSTSDFARSATEMMDDLLPEDMTLSPVQIDHLIEGYFGWLGMVTVGALDTIMIEPARELIHGPRPPRATKRIDEFDWLGPLPIPLRSVVSAHPRKSIAEMEIFYEQMHEVNELQNAYNKYKRDGLYDEARKVLAENGDLLRWRKAYSKVQSYLSKLGKMKAHIENDMNMTPLEKRRELDKIYEQRNEAVLKLKAFRESVESEAGPPPEATSDLFD